MIFILWAVYHCFKLLDKYVIYYYCVLVLFCCGVVFLIRIFFLNTDYSARGCEWPSFKSEGKINTQYHEDVPSVLYIIGAKVFCFFILAL